MTLLKKHINGLLPLLFLAVLYSCSNGYKSASSGYGYNTRIVELSPLYKVYHNEEKTSTLYFKLNTNELLYVRKNAESPFKATVNIHYQLYNQENKKTLLDSATNVLIHRKTTANAQEIIGEIPLELIQGNKYILTVRVRDINKRVEATEKIYIDKENKYNNQYFLFTSASNEVVFNQFTTSLKQLNILSNYHRGKVTVKATATSRTDISAPPFSSQKNTANNIAPDTTYIIDLLSGKSVFKPQFKGVYQFYVNNNKAASLNFFSNNYPRIIDYEGMVDPLRYICTSAEYEQIKTAENKREAIEEFWLKRTNGSKPKASSLIASYYGRIQLANNYFTSYKEGWKTDRGMICIIMGFPDNISRFNNGETWIYGVTNSIGMGLNFSFRNNNQAYTNDFILDRNRYYKTYWYSAVETWRNGRPYRYN